METPAVEVVVMANEARAWIIRALATRWQQDDGLSAPAIAGDGFWSAVASLAQANRVSGLLYRQVRAGKVVVPHSLQILLTAIDMTVPRWLAARRTRVTEIVRSLSGSGVPFLVSQGWGLLPLLYENDLSQRPPGDIDLFVPRPDREAAIAVLQQLGYRQSVPDTWPGFCLRYDSNTQMDQEGASSDIISVDLHWEVLSAPWYWQRLGKGWVEAARRADMGEGVFLPVPRPTDLLVHLCVHQGINHHGQSDLFRFYDIALLLHEMGTEIDWRAVIEQAAGAGVVLPLRVTLQCLEEIWPGTVPGEAMQALVALPVSRGERWVYSWAVDHAHNAGSDIVLKLATLPGLRCRLLCLLQMAFPSPAYMRRRYGLGPQTPWFAGYLRRAAIGVQQMRGHLGKTTGKE
jgi:hypothetical protein